MPLINNASRMHRQRALAERTSTEPTGWLRRWLRERKDRKIARECGCAWHTNARNGWRPPLVTQADPGVRERGGPVPNYCDPPVLPVNDEPVFRSLELEWAYELLAKAERDEARKIRRERCLEAGEHQEPVEITQLGDWPLRWLICNSCGEHYKEAQ